MNQGETVALKIVPKKTREPAVIWTWRMMLMGAFLFALIGIPCDRHAMIPPLRCVTSAYPASSNFSAARWERLPERQ